METEAKFTEFIRMKTEFWEMQSPWSWLDLILNILLTTFSFEEMTFVTPKVFKNGQSHFIW